MPRIRSDGPQGAADAWGGVCPFPVPGRLRKPRENGITMIIDKGVGPAATEDYLDLVGATVDLLKLAFGTTAFYSEPLLRRKIELCARHGVACYPGGTFLKVAARRPKPTVPRRRPQPRRPADPPPGRTVDAPPPHGRRATAARPQRAPDMLGGR